MPASGYHRQARHHDQQRDEPSRYQHVNGIQRHGFQTLISSVKTIAPISAEKAEAERLLTVIAVISGPASRMMPMTMSWTTPARRPAQF